MVTDGHEITREEFIVFASDVDQAFPDDLVSVCVSSVGDQRKQRTTSGVFVYRAEMVVSEHDGK